MATITCNVEEYHRYIGPRIRNVIQSLTRPRKKELGRCEECQQKAPELDAAHLPGRARVAMISEVLERFSTSDGLIQGDLRVIERAIVDAHLPIEGHFRMLCRPCHLKLGD